MPDPLIVKDQDEYNTSLLMNDNIWRTTLKPFSSEGSLKKILYTHTDGHPTPGTVLGLTPQIDAQNDPKCDINMLMSNFTIV